MNRMFVLYLLGTKTQDFMTTALNFGFLLIFYQLTGSALFSGSLTACSIIISRVVMFFLIPMFKKSSPIKVTVGISAVMAVAACIATLLYSILSKELYFYLGCSVVFSIMQEVSRSFSNSILPVIVDKESLFKANGINGIFFNVSQISAPLISYYFSISSMTIIFLIYFVIALLSAIVMAILFRFSSESIPSMTANRVGKRNMAYFSGE